MEKTVAKFHSFEAADKADRDFYRKFTPPERLDLLLQLLNHVPEQRLERVYRLTKFSRRWIPDRRRVWPRLPCAASFHRRPRHPPPPEQVIQLGRAPHRIDLLTSISGVRIDEAFATKVGAKFDEKPVAFLSKRLLIANRRAVARPQDLADLTELDESSS